MPDDLLARIAVEIDERLQWLWPAVQESERLCADLRALEGEMEVADETIDTALAAPVADGASAADVAPAADVTKGEVAVPAPDVVAEAGIAAPVFRVAPVGEVAVPAPDVVAAEAAPVAEVAALVLDVTAVAEVAAPAPDVASVAEVAAPIAEVAPAAEMPPSPPVCEVPRPRPLLSPKVLRLMDSPGRGPLRGRGVGRARRPAAPVADRLGMGGGASKHA